MKRCAVSLLLVSILAANMSLVCRNQKKVDINNLPDKIEIIKAPILITTLRNKKSTRQQFCRASNKLANRLAGRVEKYLPQKKISINTVLAPTFGFEFSNGIILVPILRSGEALLPSFQEYFDYPRVGTIGFERDENTAKASCYYKKFPKIKPNDIFVILDPMLATGGTSGQTIKFLIDNGVKQENIIFAGVIAATEGLYTILKNFPNIRKIIVAAVDDELNDKKFIVPGLGDYGDIYFGTDEYEEEEE